MIGTTITPWMQFFLQSTVVDKGLRVESYVYEKWDVYIGSILSDLIAFFIVVACGATIYTSGLNIESAADAAVALRPLGRQLRDLAFCGGTLQRLASLGGGAAAFDPRRLLRSVRMGDRYIQALSRGAGILRHVYFTILFGALVVLIPKVGLIDAMVNSQAVCGILLPVILIFMLKPSTAAEPSWRLHQHPHLQRRYLGNGDSLDRHDHRLGRWDGRGSA